MRRCKFGVSLKGSFGARYLKTNEVYAENTQGSLLLGKIKKMEEVNFSSGVGAIFSYKFVPNLQINLEPAVKYYYGDPQILKPYVLSIQAGIQYNFDLFGTQK